MIFPIPFHNSTCAAQPFNPDTDQIDAAIALWRFIAARQAVEVVELAGQGLEDVWRLAAKRATKRANVLTKNSQPRAPTRTRDVPARVGLRLSL